MAAAVDAAEERKALDAKITDVEKELQGASGDEKVALQQRLTALEQRLAALEQRLAAQEQQKLLLMQQQSGATGWAHSQGAGLLVANLLLCEQMFCRKLHFQARFQ
jgi:hypothetical protein